MHKPRSASPVSRLTTVDEVEEIVGRPASAVMLKQVTELDVGCRSILAHSPLAAFGYRDAAGTARTTFVGGTPGFAHVHSPTRLSFAHTGSALVPGGVSLFFLLPGVGEILRVNGAAAARGRRVHVDIEQAYVHCAQAVLRSGLWQPPATEAAPGPVVAGDAGPLGGPGIADFLNAAPFLALSTWDTSGGSDTSPRGERSAVVRIIDGHTLALADRKGNKRADTLHNLLQDDRLSLAALVPGRDAVLHAHGRASITDDPELLQTMALRGVPPHLAVVVDVEDAVITGNDALARAALWAPGTRYDRAVMPDMMAVAGAHLASGAAAADGGPPAFLLRAVQAIPGISRLLRRAADRGYRSSLAKEGYEGLEPAPAAGRRSLLRRRRPLTATAAPQLLRAVRVAEVRHETADALTLVLEDVKTPQRPFDFKPGQYFTLVADIDGAPYRRAYSATSIPGECRLHLMVKRVDEGRFSTHVHRQVRVGDQLAVRGPSGTFHAVSPPSERTVLIAAGSGMTPMMSMIRTQLSAETSGSIALLYSSRTRQDVIFGDELDRMAAARPDRLGVTHVLSADEGRLNEEKIRSWVSALPPGDAHFFVCGPEQLMAAVQQALRRLEIPDDRLHQERFTAGQAPGGGVKQAQEMTVWDDGRPLVTTTVAPGQTLLEAGLAAGVAMEHSCTVGNCGECVVRLRSGQVTQAEPNCLNEQQKADGYILACTSCPLSKVVLDIAPEQPDS
ncbi:2Fe-2S iron-sulfur cluster-binding protein [Streptomyces sp. NPDC047061]|uniref:2Fe-2S iron-sulfur cluster-binding protein n=1 Tax=Streptomyces sp. NPDC047061 TaxID=3154605 RepID=UPI0033ED38D4